MTSLTTEELLLYLYNETTPRQTKNIEETLQRDWSLREKLAVLRVSKERLNRIVEKPRTETVLKVLNYAREKSVEKV
ncbi:MAG: hypothetical protein IT214_10920 [Chitinophagaceae bacterium]|nr:hypothetical protein [Chitinophagaceae bacterium]